MLEYGELRFSFNEEDFSQRVEQAAVKLDFVEVGLAGEELQDLLELAVNGRADLIVSGDGDLPALNPFRDIPIVTPAMFVQGVAR